MHKLTPDAFANFEKELRERVESRKTILAELIRARDLGDRSENAAYKVARSQLSRCDKRIQFLQKVIDQSEVVETPEVTVRGISVGHIVTIQDGEKTLVYRLVESIQADISKGDISTRSPLGRSLLGKNVQDTIHLVLPQVTRHLVVISVQ